MTILENKDGSVVGRLHRNIFLSEEGKVLAILLGHCVFGSDGIVSGKYFRHRLYNLKGEILAKESSGKGPSSEGTGMQESAWKIIMQIKDHNCPHIDPSENWANESIDKHFN